MSSATFDNLRNPEGERLDCTFTPAEASKARSSELVLLGHGVTANKDRHWAVILADALARAGFASLRFSFSGNGDSEGDFRQSTPTKEVADLGAVLDDCENWKVTYVGHSMGAAVGVIRASTDPRITRLVSLGGMVDTADFAQRKFGDLIPGESFMWDKPECPLSQVFMDDMAAIGSVADLAEGIQRPWLLVHGTDDTVVPIEESKSILTRAGDHAELVELAGADHVFSGDAAKVMASHVVSWLYSLEAKR